MRIARLAISSAAPVALAVLASCWTANRADPQISAAAHMETAGEKDRQAQQHQQAAAIERSTEAYPLWPWPGECVDTLRWPEISSGGEPLEVIRPCWTDQPPGAEQGQEADRLRRQAQEHRRAARDLMEAARRSCRGIPETELSRSPFARRADIVEVAPYRERGELAGARIWFRKTRGVSAQWLRRTIGCDQARAAVAGHSPAFLPESPAVLPGVTVLIVDHGDRIAVTVRSHRPEVAAQILSRANALVKPTR